MSSTPEPVATIDDSFTVANLVAVVRNDTAEFPEAGQFEVPAAIEELRRRAREADEPDATEAVNALGDLELDLGDDVGEDGKADDGPDWRDAPSPEAALVAALANAQAEFPPIEKRHTGEVKGRSKDGTPFSYSYSYADLADVLGAVRPVLAAQGLAITQRTEPDGGKIWLRTELRHVGGAILDTVVELGQSSASPQQFGGALTYLRRYELVTLLGVAAEQDLDAQDVETPSNGRAAAPELPAWARDATVQRRRELIIALEPLLGERRAKALARSVADTFGVMPDGVVGFAKALAGHYVLEDPAGVADRHRAAFDAEQARLQAAAADAEREAQDARAEAPDTPAAEDGELSLEEVAAAERAADDQPAAGSVDPEVPDEVLEGARNGEANAVAELDATLRAAGCSCESPTRVELNQAQAVEGRNDACPVRGHGIPY